MFYFNEQDEATSKRRENGYIQRPEAIEGKIPQTREKLLSSSSFAPIGANKMNVCRRCTTADLKRIHTGAVCLFFLYSTKRTL